MTTAHEIRNLIEQTTDRNPPPPNSRRAQAAGVEPRAYLGEAARRGIRNPGTVTLAGDLKWAELHGS